MFGTTCARSAGRPRPAGLQHKIYKRNASEADLAKARPIVGQLIALTVEDIDARTLHQPPRYRCQDVFLDDSRRLILVLTLEEHDANEREDRSCFGGGAAATGL